jgi:hypothetical protein
LLNDVHDGAQYLARLLEFPFEQTYRVRRQINQSPLVWTSPSIANRDEKSYAFIRGQLLCRLEEVDEVQLSGLLDPASVAWELLPFSFVADWFIPIGSYLAKRSFAQSLKGTFVKTISRRVYCRYAGTVTNSGPNYYSECDVGAKALYRFTEMTRTVTSELQVPLPRFRSLKEVPSWTRASNALALLIQGHGSYRGNTR